MFTQSVPAWGPELAECDTGKHVAGMLATLHSDPHPKWKNLRCSKGLECDEGGIGVDVGGQNVPKWGAEIAYSRASWRVDGIDPHLK